MRESKKNYLFVTLRQYDKKNFFKDVFSGIIVAAMTIPIAMGYAQIAGLPPVYGLYGSFLPILIFAALSSSPQLIFGVDAAPAALVGGFLASAGIAFESDEAMVLVPVITFLTACWLLLFSVCKGGKLVRFISESVVGGFITGITTTIILMQIPKLYGGTAASGELFELIGHIIVTLKIVNLPSLILGCATLAAIILVKKVNPRIPMAIIVMVIGALMEMLFHFENYGIKLLPEVTSGLPFLKIPDLRLAGQYDLIGISLTVALVITAETLLTEHNYARKNNYTLRDNQEILAFSAGNFLSALSGSIPINGSVSRTVVGEQMGGKTQMMSLVAGACMAGLLLFATDFISLLPVPVLTAIVISALMSVLEIKLAKRLFRVDRTEFYIFMGAFLGVIILGTLYGVIIGVVLSFVAVLSKAVMPPMEHLGIIPGKNGFYTIERNRNAQPICHVVIIKFAGSLFFANIERFEKTIMESISPDTRVVIIDGSGVSSIDLSAADRLCEIVEKMRKRKIRFYLTGHMGRINDTLRSLGAEKLLIEGVARQTIDKALLDANIHKPYMTETSGENRADTSGVKDFFIQEFEWAFGDDAMEAMERHVKNILNNLTPTDESENLDTILHAAHNWENLSYLDEDEILEQLEMHLPELARKLCKSETELESQFENRRFQIEKILEKENPLLLKKLRANREELDRFFEKKDREAYRLMLARREAFFKQQSEKMS